MASSACTVFDHITVRYDDGVARGEAKQEWTLRAHSGK
jgi:hypothetical protein